MKGFPSESVLLARGTNPKYVNRRKGGKGKHKDRFPWMKDFPNIKGKPSESSTVRVFDSHEFRFPLVAAESADSRLERWAASGDHAFDVFLGFCGADAYSHNLTIQVGPETVQYVYSLLRYLSLPEKLVQRFAYVVTCTPGLRFKEVPNSTTARQPYEFAGSTKISYMHILSLKHFPKFRKAVLAMDPKNVSLHAHKPGYLLGFHFGDGCICKDSGSVQQRVAIEHAPTFAARTGMTLRYDAKKVANARVPGGLAATIAYLDSLYAGFEPGMPVFPKKYKLYLGFKKKLTKRIEEGFPSTKKRVKTGTVSAPEKHAHASPE